MAVEVGDAAVLTALGEHLGTLADEDLAQRCREGSLDPGGRNGSRAARKRALTTVSSSRWAGAITRASEDQWQLAMRNLAAEANNLRAATAAIRRRLAVPAGGRLGRLRGYRDQGERFAKQRRLQILQGRLDEVDGRIRAGRVSVCRGGRDLARARHHLQEAALEPGEWRQQWAARRMFICADGEAAKVWGNETIRWHPDLGWLEVKLPAVLAHLANRPHGRYRLSQPVSFPYRGADVAAQAAGGAVRYDISYHPAKRRWYLDASWTFTPAASPTLKELRGASVLGVDLNDGHLAAWVTTADGNPLGPPFTVALNLAGRPASTRDGRQRAAISELLRIAQEYGCEAIAVEDLDFVDARAVGRETLGRGRRGKRFRRCVAGIPTAGFRDRLTQMAANRGLWVIAVDPAYTSRWAAQHWRKALDEKNPTSVSGHHGAAVVIARRGLGHRARRRRGVTEADQRIDDRELPARPEPSMPTIGVPETVHRQPGDRNARGQPHPRRKTRPAERPPPARQVAQDRSAPPVEPGLPPAHFVGTVIVAALIACWRWRR